MAFVTEQQLIKVLRKYNTWWTSPLGLAEKSKPQKRLAFHEALSILTHPTLRRFCVLSGARRVGKTTIMYQVIESLISQGIDPHNILYVTFDNPIIKFVNVEDVINAYDSLYPISGTRYLFFDEIQYTENWELWMKTLYDSRIDIRLAATGSASPILDKGSSDSGIGRWTTIRVPTMSFYEYCDLLGIPKPEVPQDIRLASLALRTDAELGDLTSRFSNLVQHFNRYLIVGGFPELVLSDDDEYSQRLLREDVVDKVIKRDVLTLFSIRSPILMEKLFLYLCMNSGGLFNITTASKKLSGTSQATLDNYISALEKSNLIYISNPMYLGSKGALKGKPKIYVADPAIRSAALMTENPLEDEDEMGVIIEATVYKHIISFFQTQPAQVGYYRSTSGKQKEVDVVIEKPREKILFEVKYRNDSHILKDDAIVDLCNDDKAQITSAFLITKKLDDFGFSKHDTKVPILRMPALVFLYLLGLQEASGQAGRM